MANTQKYLNHLLQNTGITPACSEEEREAADVIAAIFRKHGFEPEIQEFSASNTPKMVQAVMGVVLFVGTFLATFSGIPGVVGLLLVLAVAVIYTIERLGKPVVSQLGAGGLSQNVIAYHKASGPLASPRNRPVVVVAHYDSPRADFMEQEPFARYRPLLFKALPPCMVASAILLVVRLLPFPSGVKNVLWFLALLTSLVPLINAVAIIANRFVLPYTSGSVCNKSSVAAMLGVMNEVAPYEGRVEFPDDIPFEEYFSEQVRMAQEAAAAAEAERAAREAARAAKRGGVAPEELEGEPEELEEEGEEPAGETAAFGAVEEVAATAVSAPVEPVISVEPEVPEPAPAEAGLDAGEEPVPVEPPRAAESEAEQVSVPEVEPEPVSYPLVNDEGNLRFGEEIVRSLGMLSASCAIVYEEQAKPVSAPVAPAPSPQEESQEVAWAGPQDVPLDEEAEDLLQGVADDDVDWQTMPEPIPLVDFYGEDEFEAGEPGPSVLEIIRDWVSRLISFVRSKIEQIRAGSESEVLEAEDEAGEAPEEEAEQTSDTVAADEALVEEDAVEEDAAEAMEAEDGATKVDAATADSGQEEDSNEAEQTIVSEAEAEKTTERTAVVADGSPAGAGNAPAADAEVTRQNEPAEKKTNTLDALMAEISAASAPAPARQAPQRVLNIPSVDSAPAANVAPSSGGASRSALFDLPDPAATPIDPFASNDVPVQVSGSSGGAGGGRSAGGSESMSDWLGLGSDFDAKQSGREIGSWANFDDDSSWKGGATSANGASEAELREAVTSMGDDELLGHDIWFVAAGASESGNAGIEAFLKEHRSMLRGVFVINLECVGAGQVAMIATEGRERVLKGDRRIMNLVSRVSEDFHHEFGSVELPYLATDAYASMNMSLRSLTIGGVDGTGFALSHSEEDQPYNVNPDNITIVADVVTEVIRRS